MAQGEFCPGNVAVPGGHGEPEVDNGDAVVRGDFQRRRSDAARFGLCVGDGPGRIRGMWNGTRSWAVGWMLGLWMVWWVPGLRAAVGEAQEVALGFRSTDWGILFIPSQESCLGSHGRRVDHPRTAWIPAAGL